MVRHVVCGSNEETEGLFKKCCRKGGEGDTGRSGRSGTGGNGLLRLELEMRMKIL